MEDLKYWLALLHTPGIGSRRFRVLLKKAGTPAALFRASPSEWSALGLNDAVIGHLRSPDWEEVEKELQWLEQSGRHLITLIDPRYPSLLREIPDPPPLLFVQGDPRLLSEPQLAMVGSRNPSTSGRKTARDFARFLARAGITITSGLATGIDGASHTGALDEAGTTIAVTGTGLDRIYPARHRELAHRIAEQGALVSEFPPGTPARPGHFPRRNRIISGLSLGTLVVEAARQSGSLISARLAAEQGREVFAIPGSIHNPLARGCHALIRQGAKLVETVEDVLEELAPLLGSLELSAEQPSTTLESEAQEPDEEYRLLLDCMEFDPVSIDLLIERSGLTTDAVSSMLLLLELEGHVLSAPGGRYCRTTSRPTGSGQHILSKDSE